MAFKHIMKLKDILPLVGYDTKFMLEERTGWNPDALYGPYEYGDDVGAFADREVLSIETYEGYVYFVLDKEGGLGRWVADE